MRKAITVDDATLERVTEYRIRRRPVPSEAAAMVQLLVRGLDAELGYGMLPPQAGREAHQAPIAEPAEVQEPDATDEPHEAALDTQDDHGGDQDDAALIARIRAAMDLRGQKQSAFAREAGVGQGALSRVLAGKTRISEKLRARLEAVL